MLRQTRVTEFHRDIVVLSQTFERHRDVLDSVVKVT